jgi:hypothetical protein
MSVANTTHPAVDAGNLGFGYQPLRTKVSTASAANRRVT